MDNSMIMGDYFKRLRLMHGLSRTELASRIDMSEKTLQRIELGQVDAKVSQLVTFMNYFAVSPAEVLAQTNAVLPNPAMVAKEMAAATDLPQVAQLADELTRLTRKYRTEWLKTSQIACEIQRLALAGDDEAAQRLANRMVNGFLLRDFITGYDFQLLTLVAGCVSFDRLKLLLISGQLHRHLSSAAESSVVSRFYHQLLDCAFAEQDPAAVRYVCDVIQSNITQADCVSLQAYRHFAGVLVLALDGQNTAAQHDFEALKSGLIALGAETELAEVVPLFRGWLAAAGKVVSIAGCTKTLTHQTNIAVNLKTAARVANEQ